MYEVQPMEDRDQDQDQDTANAEVDRAIAWWTTADAANAYDAALESQGLGHLHLWADLENEERAALTRAVDHSLRQNGHLEAMDQSFQAAAGEAIKVYLDDNDLLEPVDQ